MMRLRQLTAKVGLAVGALVVSGLLVELVLQVVFPLVYRPRFTKIDPVVGWTHRSSVAATSAVEGHRYRESYNSHGYRSPEHSFSKTPGSYRVVFLGDSFVDGSEVGDEELFTWHLQQSSPGTEVVNLGVYGYSTAQELITLERDAFQYEPDLVVLVTLSNDFSGNGMNISFFGPAPRFLLRGDSLVLESTDAPAAVAAFRSTNLPIPGMGFLHRNSLVYYFLNHFIYQKLRAARISELLKQQGQALAPTERVELYRRLVGRVKRACDERGVGFLVVFAYERAELREGRDSPATVYRAAIEQDGVATIDLYDELRRLELMSDSSLYYEKNIHWNARGHRVVAELLRSSIETRLPTR